jgi:hypothetical protein
MLLALGLLSCDKPPEKTSTQPASSTGATAAATPAAGDEGVATEEDFEDEAEQKITAQNAEDELDKLEKEIGQK